LLKFSDAFFGQAPLQIHLVVEIAHEKFS